MVQATVQPVDAQVHPDFQGVWTANLGSSQCTTNSWKGQGDNDSDAIFKVSKQRVEYWEANCSIVRFRAENAAGDTDRTATVDMECDGEGEVWRKRSIWYLAKIDGRKVLIEAETHRAEGESKRSRQARPHSTPRFSIALECK